MGESRDLPFPHLRNERGRGKEREPENERVMTKPFLKRDGVRNEEIACMFVHFFDTHTHAPSPKNCLFSAHVTIFWWGAKKFFWGDKKLFSSADPDEIGLLQAKQDDQKVSGKKFGEEIERCGTKRDCRKIVTNTKN